jgi:hypothetical protein
LTRTQINAFIKSIGFNTNEIADEDMFKIYRVVEYIFEGDMSQYKYLIEPMIANILYVYQKDRNALLKLVE